MRETSGGRPTGSARRILKTGLKGLFFLGALWMAALVSVAVGDDLYKGMRRLLAPDEDPRAFLVAHRGSELALQIYRDINAGGREYHPIVEWKSRPLRSPTLNIDAGGRRIHKAGKDNNRPNAQVIGFFGGSATLGIGATDDTTIPAHFDVITRDYEVTNYAQNGWTARQSLAQLINLIAEGEAINDVVFFDGFNDVRILCNRSLTDDTSGTLLEARFSTLMQRGRNTEGIYNILVRPIVEAFTKDHPQFREDYVCADDPAEADRVAGALVRTWAMARAVTENNGGRFFAFLQPSRFTGAPRLDYLPTVASDGARADRLQREFDAVYPLIRQKLASTSIPWADLSRALDGDQPYYVDFVHVVGEGNAVIAQRIHDQIAQAGDGR